MSRRRILGLGSALSLLGATPADARTGDPPIFRGSRHQFTTLVPADPAPDILLRGPFGAPFEVARRRGRLVVLNFWASWCAPCAGEMASLDTLAGAVATRPIDVVAVSIDAEAVAATRFAQARGLDHLRVLLDPQQTLGALGSAGVAAGALPLLGLPMTYLVDRCGRTAGYLSGAADWNEPRAHRLLEYYLDMPCAPAGGPNRPLA